MQYDSIGVMNNGGTCVVIITDLEPHFHPDLASTLQYLSVHTLFASIVLELRKLHFRVTSSKIK